ncbi:MAG TPA: hypothetical protein VKE51_37475 [Vicinamibacterales bacterium]|nr:hypothetical protein [Vicinamibacterales bacterium]
MHELISATRTLRRTPRFTLFAALLLAVAIGANTMRRSRSRRIGSTISCCARVVPMNVWRR